MNKKLNSGLRELISGLAEKLEAGENILPQYDTTNLAGHPAYSLPPELKLLSILNTSKLQPQFYRSQKATVVELYGLIEKLASEDPYLVAQMIVWSRCCGEGMRSVNSLAAAMLSQYISGTDWARRFYGRFDKKTTKTDEPKGGCVWRLDDMLEIKDFYYAMTGRPLTNAMKKGFASVLETADNYALTKYKKTVIDITNLVHPDIKKSKALTEVDGIKYHTIDAIMKGYSVDAETWESANSEAGQIVAQAVKDGTLTEEQAKEVLREAKNDNWEQLLDEGKLGILAAIRNLRNILKGGSQTVIDKVASLVSDGVKIREGKVMPYQLELAQSIVKELNLPGSRQLMSALEQGMVEALPNLKELLPGRTLVMVDCSGSMTDEVTGPYAGCRARCIDKAAILAAMLAKGTDADIIRFGDHALWYNYNPEDSLGTIADGIKKSYMGGTRISTAFDLIRKDGEVYDRIFLLSDNQANHGCLRSSYRQYLNIADPYVYCIDLCGYGTVPLAGEKVHYYNGYGYSMLDNIASIEFRPNDHIEQVRKVKI